MTDVATDLPIYNTPIFDARGNLSEVWWRFFATLLTRTGGLQGIDIAGIRAQLEALYGLQAATVAMPQRPVDNLPPPVARPARAVQDPMALEFAHTHGRQYDPVLHALVTTLADGFMSAVDKVKLDALTVPIVAPSEIVADVVTQNSTADGAIVTLTFPANSLAAAASFNLRLYGLITSAAIAGTLSVWIKIGATKVLTQTFTLPGLGTTNTGLFYTASATVRAAGGAGNVQLSSLMTSNNNALNGGPVVATVNAAIDTTIANTLTLGWNWSVANAGNIATAKNASITLEKQ